MLFHHSMPFRPNPSLEETNHMVLKNQISYQSLQYLFVPQRIPREKNREILRFIEKRNPTKITANHIWRRAFSTVVWKCEVAPKNTNRTSHYNRVEETTPKLFLCSFCRVLSVMSLHAWYKNENKWTTWNVTITRISRSLLQDRKLCIKATAKRP